MSISSVQENLETSLLEELDVIVQQQLVTSAPRADFPLTTVGPGTEGVSSIIACQGTSA